MSAWRLFLGKVLPIVLVIRLLDGEPVWPQSSSARVAPHAGGSYAVSLPELQDRIEGQCPELKERTTTSDGMLLLLTGPGPKTKSPGYYYKVGQSIANKLNVENVETSRTECNLWGLQTGAGDLALVQSDIAHDMWFSHPTVSVEPTQQITLVAPLFVEAIHVLLRPHLNLTRLADLRGRRVWLGPEHSFTVLSARRILDAAGMSEKEMRSIVSVPSRLI